MTRIVNRLLCCILIASGFGGSHVGGWSAKQIHQISDRLLFKPRLAPVA